MTMNYWITDTETVGLNPPAQPASGVVEVAWASIDPITLEITDQFVSRVNPGCPIDPRASAVHGISDADVADCQTLGEVFKPKGPTVNCGHNSAFDVKFLSPYYENLAGSLCTLALARQYIKDAPNHKLGTLVQHLGLAGGKAHSALGDVHSTIQLLRVLVDKAGRDLPTLVAAARKPKIIHIMPFGKYRGQSVLTLPKDYVVWFLGQDVDQDLRLSLTNSLKTKV